MHTWWTPAQSSAWLRAHGVRARPGRFERLARRGRIRAAFYDGHWVLDPDAVRELASYDAGPRVRVVPRGEIERRGEVMKTITPAAAVIVAGVLAVAGCSSTSSSAGGASQTTRSTATLPVTTSAPIAEPTTRPTASRSPSSTAHRPAGTSTTATGVQTVLPNIKDFTSDIVPRYRTLDALMAAGGDSKAELAKDGLTYTDSRGSDVDPQARTRTIKHDGTIIGLMQIFWNPRAVELSLAELQTKELNSQPVYALVNWDQGWEYVIPDLPSVRGQMLKQQKKLGGVLYHLVPN